MTARVNRRTRRAFLGGGAVVVGLPFLESVLPRELRAAPPADPVRLLYLCVPNGLDMETFRPTATGTGYPTPPMLAPLEALKADFSVITGLDNPTGRPDDLGDHAAGTASFITCAHAFKSETDIRLGISADQVAANAFGHLTRLPSLQLGIDGGGGSGNCDSGYSCTYARNISGADETTPLPKITDPKQVFDQIFAGFDPDESAADAERRALYNKSILDHVTGDVTALMPRLGYTDREKLEQYLEGIRQQETRLTGSGPSITCTPGAEPPTGRGLAYDVHLKAMLDLTVTALTCDATRIVTLMFGNALSNRTHPFLGITGGHHDISHHSGDTAKIAELAQIGLWEMEQLAYLLSALKQVPDGTSGQNLLYNSAVYLSSDISDGNRHNHDDLPVILAGNAGGRLHPGQHIAYPTGRNVTKEKMSNLLITVLEAAGVAGATLGDSTGPLAGI